MLRVLATISIVLTGADHLTTWLCLREHVQGWDVSEANPVAEWLFEVAGLVPGLAIDSAITLCAVAFLLTTGALPRNAKLGFLAVITLSTGYAVANNIQAIDAMGLWPGGVAHTMNRQLILALSCVGLTGLSCQGPSAFLGAVQGLPEPAAASAQAPAPPAALLAVNEVVPATATESDAEDLSSIEMEILEELRSRHTGLAEYELILLAQTIMSESARHALDPALVVAVIFVESSGYHLAVSPVGALGLMQLLPSTGEELAHKLGVAWHGPDSLFDPIINVKLGTAYLRWLNDRYDSIPTALAAYNWGPGRIDRRLRRGATVPSRYIGQVMRAYGAYDSNDAGRS